MKEIKYKDVIINTLQFLVQNGHVKLNAFVIMSNPAIADKQACSFYMAGYGWIRSK